ncbi:hypothetical protein [Phycobacter azelaicus]|uniref:hypothetical protein n=1 Tax=Phycobacter azelaicus TaxID=2668075 RepID=UPI0018664F18|nr:hypothetical protein [Phycobacter azelaicus]MBE1297164.1 hypothetical protein [Paracoccaceae bacterium]
MTTFEAILSITAVIVSAAVIAYMRHLGKISGRDRPHDPERLRRFIANAPYDALKRRPEKETRCSPPSPEK